MAKVMGGVLLRLEHPLVNDEGAGMAGGSLFESRLVLKDRPQRVRTSKRVSIFPCLQQGHTLRLVPRRDTAAVH